MKKILLICTALISISSISQVPNWAWANTISGSTGSSEERGVSIATDLNGNVFVIGHFGSPTILLGSTTLTNTATNGRDIFIAKYNSSGAFIWAKSFGGAYDDNPTSITTDNLGNILFTGDFWSPTIAFGTTTLTNSPSYNDVFVVKLNTSGTVLWAKKAGGNSQDDCNSVKTDSSRNVIITGSYGSPTFTFGTSSLTNVGSSDVYIAKYNENGSLLWTKRIAGTSYESANDITTDSNDNIIVTGNFSSTSFSDGTNSLTNTGTGAMFLIKYSPTGSYLWSKSWSGSSLDRGAGVTTDSSNNVLLVGNYGDTTINFDGIILNCSYASSAITKYDALGSIIWAKTCSDGKFSATSISTDTTGNVFLSGYTICPQILFGSTILNNSGSNDSMVVRYNSNGVEIFGKIVGGSYDEYGAKVVTDLNNNQYFLGSFMSMSLNFGTTTITNTGTGNNSNQIFFSKLNNSSLNVPDFGFENNFSIYPNPIISQGNLFFKDSQTNCKIEIFDIHGRIISTTLFSGNQYTIERNKLVSGIYLVKVTTENNNSVTGKFIIK
jgi:hypothetical protein